MMFQPESNDLNEYLKDSDVINFKHSNILELAQYLKKESQSEIELIQKTYEWVRDKVPHSFDIQGKTVTCNASDVLMHKEGICFAKSHLLAALLRANEIPVGFCYQRLILDDKDFPYLILHGLNAVYIKHLKKWIRLDARGNKDGVNAQFSLDKEQLAFPIRSELGEEDLPVIYVNPLDNVVKSLMRSKSMDDLRLNLPK